MVTFMIDEKTKNNIPIKLCGICKSEYKEKYINFYSEKIRNYIFPNTKDEFSIDFLLAKLLTKNPPPHIHVLGASIFLRNIELNTGGIIGSPHNISSSENIMEYLGNDLYCIAYSGKFGTVFRSTEQNAKNLYEKLNKLLYLSNKEIIPIVENLLETTDLHIIVSDGSGKESFFYVSHKS